MRKVVVTVVAILCSAGLMAGRAIAGQAQDATIFGTVTDTSGAVLPGVTVTVSSPALQVQQLVEVTDARGEYRVTPLPLGTYTVEFTLPGFQTRRNEGVRLTAGFQARVDVQLGVATVAETVTVSGQSPVVDVQTTRTGTQVTREILEVVPTSRNSFNSLLTLAAGARPAMETGRVQGSDPVLSSFGREGGWVTIDGLSVTSPTGNPGHQTAMNYGSIEDAQVTTIGSSAEAIVPGVQLSVITKSGSNEFHGGGLAAQTPVWAQRESNLTDKLRAQGIRDASQFDTRWDAGGDLGGRLVRDKLWFYGGARRRQEQASIIGAFFGDGSPSYLTTDQRFYNGKGTAQLTQDSQLIGTYAYRSQDRFNGPTTRFHDPDTSRQVLYVTKQGTGTWQLVKGSKVLSVNGGGHYVVFPPNPFFTENSAYEDEVLGTQGGMEEDGGFTRQLYRWEGKATLNWYKADWMHGNHNLKFGGEYHIATRPEIWIDVGPTRGNYTLFYRNGVPFAVDIKNSPTSPVQRMGYLGMFAQDSWSMNRRLTLNLGLRFANNPAWLPEQCREAAFREFAALFPAQCFDRVDMNTWNTIQPRLHAAFDVAGDGKTLLKGGYGRFYVIHEGSELNIANNNARRVARFLWRDTNNNRRWDAGESNLDLTGPDFVSIANPSGRCNTCIAAGEGAAALQGYVPNPNLQPPGVDEFSVTLERELMANFGVRATAAYLREFDRLRFAQTVRTYADYNIPITRPDPGPDGTVGTADDTGQNLTYYDYPAELRGVGSQAAMFINHDGSNANYRSFEVAAIKRLSSRWQMMSSFTATKKDVPVPSQLPLTPNAEINAADETWEWLFRTNGSFLFPGDVQASANLVSQSGLPWARVVSLRGGRQIPSLNVNAEPIGSQRTSTQTLVSLSIEKLIALRAGHRLRVGGGVYNLTNANFDLGLPQNRSGRTFGYSVNVMVPTYGELTVRYTF